MNLLTMSNRKRQRSDEPDFDQSLPISKRINQLHIRQSYDGSNSHESSDNTLCSGNNNEHWNNYPQQQVTTPDHGFTTDPHSSAPDYHPPFNADAQNPAFYDPQAYNRLAPVDDPRTTACNVPDEDPSASRYLPELSELENPYYYTANECLFYLHMEQLRRQRSV